MAEKNNSSIPTQDKNGGVQLDDELLDVTGGRGDMVVDLRIDDLRIYR